MTQSDRLGLRSIPIAGAPVNGTDEQQTVTVTGGPTGGTFRLKFQGFISEIIAFDAPAAAVRVALEALASIGAGNVTVTGAAGGPYTVTFVNDLGKLTAEGLFELQDNLLTGGAAPSVTIAESVAGVTATQRGSSTGTTLLDTVNAVFYQNTGTPTAPTWDRANAPLYDSGLPSANNLRVEAAVISAETVTVGADVYEIEIVNTDSTDNTQGGDFNNVTAPLTVVDAVTNYPGSTFAVGSLHRIETEIMLVTGIAGADVTFSRGVSGTTVAAHADALDVFEGDGVGVGNIAVGLVAVLTNTAFLDALVADINNRGTELVAAIKMAANEAYVYTAVTTGGAVKAADIATATTETLSGVDNVWAHATLHQGRAAGTRQAAIFAHAVDATQEALGVHRITFPFTITGFISQVYTAAGVPKNNLTDQVTIENGNRLEWDGTGAQNPVTGDILRGVAWGD